MGEIKDFRVGNQSLYDSDPDFTLSAMLLWKDDFDSRINCVTLRNLDQRRGEFVCFALRRVLILFLI